MAIEKAKENLAEDFQVIYGKLPKKGQKEFLEMQNYSEGQALEDAKKVLGPYQEPWLNVIQNYEPGSIPSFDEILKRDELRKKVHGKVLDMGAGTCWLSAKLSALDEIEHVYPVDLSEKFMKSVGARMMKYFNAKTEKISLVVSDFNDLPLEDESIDCAFFIASLHHSLAPIKTLQEVGRCLKKGGVMMILEHPPATIHIREARKKVLELSKNVTEYFHTREEWEYIIQMANVGKLSMHTFDVLSKKGWRMGIRKVFRALKLEHVLMNPPIYLFVVEKE